MKKYIILYIGIIICLLSGCAKSNMHNYMAPNLSDDVQNEIAADIAEVIATQNPAKSTVFIFNPGSFSHHLGNALVKLGYEALVKLENNKQNEGEVLSLESDKEVSYTIDWFGPDSLYIALTVDNQQRFTRQYLVSNDSVVPVKTKIIGANDGQAITQ